MCKRLIYIFVLWLFCSTTAFASEVDESVVSEEAADAATTLADEEDDELIESVESTEAATESDNMNSDYSVNTVSDDDSTTTVTYVSYDDTELLAMLDQIDYMIAFLAFWVAVCAFGVYILLVYLMVHNILKGNK